MFFGRAGDFCLEAFSVKYKSSSRAVSVAEQCVRLKRIVGSGVLFAKKPVDKYNKVKTETSK